MHHAVGKNTPANARVDGLTAVINYYEWPAQNEKISIIQYLSQQLFHIERGNTACCPGHPIIPLSSEKCKILIHYKFSELCYMSFYGRNSPHSLLANFRRLSHYYEPCL